MIRILLTTSFMAALLWWLQYEFKRKISLTQHWRWFVAALVTQAASGVLSFAIDDRILGNFLYHAIGGGVTTTLLFIYLLKTYSISLSWRVELVLLYCFVSALGIINELAEYAGELVIGNGAFSWDSHDTWRDFVANTSGAVLAWLVYRVCLVVSKTRT